MRDFRVSMGWKDGVEGDDSWEGEGGGRRRGGVRGGGGEERVIVGNRHRLGFDTEDDKETP